MTKVPAKDCFEEFQELLDGYAAMLKTWRDVAPPANIQAKLGAEPMTQEKFTHGRYEVETHAPLQAGDTVCQKCIIASAKRLNRQWAIFCETVATCFERDGRWFITLRAANGEHAADDWARIEVTASDEVWNGTPVRKFEYRVTA